MQPVSGVYSTTSVTHSRTQSANRATTEPVPDATNTDAADLRSRLEGGEALQMRAEEAGAETEETAVATGSGEPTTGSGLGTRIVDGMASRITRPPASVAGDHGVGQSATKSSGRDAAGAIDELATTMAVETATVRQSIDDGSLSQLLAQNGVQSSVGMLFNTKL